MTAGNLLMRNIEHGIEMKKSTQGYYSLIQFCPDRSRVESANIGVLLFCPSKEYLGVKMAPNNDRPIKFFGAMRICEDRLDSMKLAIQTRLKITVFTTLGDLSEFISTRATMKKS